MPTPRLGMKSLVVLVILCHIAYGGTRVAMSLAGLELKASPLAIGIILSFYNLLPMFVSISSGRLIDRVGVAKPVNYSAACLVVGTALPFLAWDIGVLYLAAVLIGLGFMTLHLCIQKAAGELGADEGEAQGASKVRARNFSVLAIGFSISGFLGPMIAGFAIDHIGYREAFGVLAIAPLLAYFGFRRFVFPESLQGKDELVVEGQAPKRVMDLIASPELLRLFTAVVVLSASWDVLQFLIPIYGKSLGLSASQIGIVLGGFAIGSFLVRLALPWLVQQFSEWPLILSSICTSVLVYALFPFFPSFFAMIALSVLLGLGLGCAQPMVLSVLHRAAPEGRIGEAVGLRLTIIGASQAILPITFGAVGAAMGMTPLFWGMAIFALVGAGYVARGTGYLNFGSKANQAAKDDDGLL
jgi:MFS family permease